MPQVSHSKISLTLQVFIFPFHCLQMVQGFFVGVFQFEELGAQRSRFFLSAFELGLSFLVLLLPLSQNLNSFKCQLVMK